MSRLKAYLGDGVYADHDGWNIILTTEDGIRETNRIVIEPEVHGALLQWIEHLPRPSRETTP